MNHASVSSTLLMLVVACWIASSLSAQEFPGQQWSRASPAEAELDAAQLNLARDYALTGSGSGYITRGGKLVLSWGDAQQRYDQKSTTKSFGSAALGLAVLDGKIALGDSVTKHHSAC